MTVEFNWFGIIIEFLTGLGIVGFGVVGAIYGIWAYKSVKPALENGFLSLGVWKPFWVLAVGILLVVTLGAISTYRPRVATEQTFRSEFIPVPETSPEDFVDTVPQYKKLKEDQDNTNNPDATFNQFRKENKQ